MLCKQLKKQVLCKFEYENMKLFTEWLNRGRMIALLTEIKTRYADCVTKNQVCNDVCIVD